MLKLASGVCSFGLACARLFDALAIQGASGHTVTAYRSDIGTIAALCGVSDGSPVSELTGEVLRAGFAEFAASRAPSSVSRARSAWQRLFDIAVADGLVVGSPMGAIPKPRVGVSAPKPVVGWEDDSVRRLLSAAVCPSGSRVRWGSRDFVLVITLVGAGLRAHELLDLTVGDVTSSSTSEPAVTVRKGKGSKFRVVPVPQEYVDALGKYLAERSEYFPAERVTHRSPLWVALPRQSSCEPKRLTTSQVEYLVKQIFRQAGVASPQGALVHSLRHTFGTQLAANGVPIEAIRNIMGHASIGTTQRYIAASGRDLRAAVESSNAWRSTL